MAKVTKKVLGFSRKKVGDVVFANFRGDTVARAYQPMVRNPRTEKQQLQRGKFAMLSGYAKAVSGGIYYGLGAAAKSMKLSPRNLFVKLNKGAITMTTPTSGTTDFSSMVVAKGGFFKTTTGTILTDEPNTISIPVTALDVEGIRAADVAVHVVVYNRDEQQGLYSSGGISTVGSIDVTVPGSWNGTRCQVWCFCEYTGDEIVSLGVKKGDISDSWFAGDATIS